MPAVSDSVSPKSNLEAAKADYLIVEKIGTKAAWELFLVQYPMGFYADLARQQLAKLSTASQKGSPVDNSQPAVTDIQHVVPPSEGVAEDRRSWAKIENSTNPDDFRAFAKRYPSSPLAGLARSRLVTLEEGAKSAKDGNRRVIEKEAISKRSSDGRQLIEKRPNRNSARPVASGSEPRPIPDQPSSNRPPGVLSFGGGNGGTASQFGHWGNN